jgi:hypothetical protein
MIAICEPKAKEVKILNNKKIWVLLDDGREISVPIVWFPRLVRASQEQLNNFKLIGSGTGLHWPDLDEDLSIKGFLLGFKGIDSGFPLPTPSI